MKTARNDWPIYDLGWPFYEFLRFTQVGFDLISVQVWFSSNLAGRAGPVRVRGVADVGLAGALTVDQVADSQSADRPVPLAPALLATVLKPEQKITRSAQLRS